VAVERKKEKEKTPAELAAEKTKRESTSRKRSASAKPKEDEPKAAKGAQQKPKEAEQKPKAAEEKPKPVESKPKPAARKPRSRRAPARRREAPEPPPRAPTRPVVRAQAKYVRSSARKARLVVEHIRGKSVEDARAVLQLTPRAVARDVEKLLASAVANAENNHDLVGDDLYVKEAYVDEGPTLKRFRPRALGRATRIRKRTSHLTLTLTPKDE
jgi:ribosomal protein L22